MKQLILAIIASVMSVGVMAQESTTRKHELRAYYGETLTFDIANLIGNSLTDALSGLHTDMKGYGAFGLGYRYSINRFGLGADVSYIGYRNDIRIQKDNPIDFRVNENYFVVLPTADFTYFKSGILRLYGGVGVGAMVGLKSQKSLTNDGKEYLKTNAYDKNSVNLAFQVNPIAIRLGNDRIGGFLEAGFGMKGLVNVGLSLKL